MEERKNKGMKMKKSFVGLLAIFLILYLIPISTSAAPIENLTAEVGSTYINFTWDFNETSSASIYIDGILIGNTTLNYYILSDLNPRENHRITLVNNTNPSEIYGSLTARTFYPPVLFYIILIFAIAFLILELLLKNEIIVLVLGVLSFILNILGFYLSFGYHFVVMAYLMLSLAVVAFLWCFMAVFSIILKGKGDFEIE